MRQNPIYQREKGGWGNPNKYYANLSRYSPFIVLGVIVLGVCAGFNPGIFAGSNSNDALTAVWMLLCLPGILLTMLTLYGSILAPALTAPLISAEKAHQTWDVLRTTPYSLNTILMAKLFGALARLRIWPALFALTLFQGFTLFCTLSFFGGELAAYGWAAGLMALLRPWTEVFFAAFAGMFFSLVLSSATTALVASYTAVALFKLFNSNVVWLVWAGYEGLDNQYYIISLIGPTLVYVTAVLLFWLGIIWQARKLANE